MLRASILLFMIALGLMAGLAIHFADERPALYTYTGVDFCGQCHASTAAGEIYQTWAGSSHARARSVLDSVAAKEYLAANSADVEDCMSCHTTLGRPELNDHERSVNAEGVGCERCHGPGSSYSQTIIMKDRAAFTAHGGSPGSLANCYSCHAENPDGHDARCPFQTEPFNADSAWPQIAHPIRTSRSYADPDTTSLADSTSAEADTATER